MPIISACQPVKTTPQQYVKYQGAYYFSMGVGWADKTTQEMYYQIRPHDCLAKLDNTAWLI